MKMRPFELVLVTIFALLALGALAMLALYKPANKVEEAALGNSVVIWGTVPAAAFAAVLRPLTDAQPAYRVVQYVEKDARTFDSEVLNALAENRGPDIIFLPSEKLVQYRSKIQALPEASFPIRDFRNLYIDGAEIFALRDGVYAYPIAIDPLVMYYNRDLMRTKNIINPPRTWEELMGQINTLVERDYSRNIIRSPLAFGEYRNVQNGFGVLSMLLLQGGSSLVVENDGQYKLQLNQTASDGGVPMERALTFYTNFASPVNPLYSWNRALPLDHDAFLAENLVLYFGKGSEATSLSIQNPNLNFDVAEVPQGAQATVRRTYASFYGLALLKSSTNKNGALTVMQLLGSADKSKVIADALHMAPAHRSTLNSGSDDRYGRIAYAAANVASAWLAPAPDKTDQIFRAMVEDVLSNKRAPADSTRDAIEKLSEVY